MTAELASLAVRKTVRVETPVQRAFEVFTERMGDWWPVDSHAFDTENAEAAVLELREGGRIYERRSDGSERDWGLVTAWEPPHRIVIDWRIGEPATEVEVRFTPEGDATRVELEHRGFEGEQRAASYDTGWDYVLGERYAGAAVSA